VPKKKPTDDKLQEGPRQLVAESSTKVSRTFFGRVNLKGRIEAKYRDWSRFFEAAHAPEFVPLDRVDADKEISVAAEAVNEGSKHAAGFFSVFLLVSVYIAVAVGSTTHLMLLNETSLPLPILGVSLPIRSFFITIPIVFVLLHLNLLIHFRMLEYQVRAFEFSLLKLKPESGEGEEDLKLLRGRYRKQLFPFFITRSMLDSEDKASLSILIRSLFWWTFFAIPVVTLIYIELQFLPYHNVGITWGHRLALVLNVAILTFGWGFTWDSGVRYRLPNKGGPVTAFLALASFLFSWLFLAIPGEPQDRHEWTANSSDSDIVAWFKSIYNHRNMVIAHEVIGKNIPTIKDRTEYLLDEKTKKTWLDSEPVTDISDRNLKFAKFSRTTFYNVKFPSEEQLGTTFTDCTFFNSDDNKLPPWVD